MRAVLAGTVGILPAGALGVSFFYHLTRQLRQIDGTVFFLERAGSASARSLAARAELHIADAQGLHALSAGSLLKPGLLDCARAGQLPEALLVCPNPDQLLGVITSCVELLELVCQAGGPPADALPLPIIVLCSNGIYFQRFRQIFIEKIEEATLLGRLPDLWPELMPRVVGRLLRGVSIQTGLREGSGAETIYRPGPRGITRIAGGDAPNRERCAHILTGKGGWFELAPNSSATRLEFDKAMVNLTGNLLGQLQSIDEKGNFHPLTLAEIVVPANQAAIRTLAHHVFQVGQAVKAYGAAEDFEAVFARLMNTMHLHRTHVPSSLQWVGLRLRQGTLDPHLTPTELWLLDPLLRYARSAGLESASQYFEDLRNRLLEKLSLLQSGRLAPASEWEI